jgi:predicted O-linked N-acetylglucosamine transferase (SPINDLY family)
VRSVSRKRRAPSWLPAATGQGDNFAQRVTAHFQEGVSLQKAGRFREANEIFRKVARRLERGGVTDATIYAAIGYTHLMLAEAEESLNFSKKALEIEPKLVQALINASAALRLKNKLDEAKEYAEKALEIDPNNPQVIGGLAMILANQGKPSQALIRASHALALDPDCLDAIGALAFSCSTVGDMELSMPYYKKYIERIPHDPGISSAMLFSMHYKPDVSREELREAHKAWGDRFAAKFKKDWPAHKNERTTNRRLRIGYISGDFRHHVVGYWTRHIIEQHSRDRVEVFCFVNNKEDAYSERIKAAADHWIPILDKSDNEVARMIQDQKIDILVDLSGHTGGNRLFVMARKPAPVQATWCGYIDSSGLEAVDYVITDEIVAPSTEASPFVEEPLRLSTGSVCFDQIPDVPEVGPLPFFRKGHITFGCFNNPSKIGPEVVRLWAEILRATPDSKLMLTYGNLADPFTRERILRLFSQHQIDESRLLLRKGQRDAALRAYTEEIDLALDTFPYTGGTTTCEALWMGVPVVALYGNHPMSRFSCSLLAYGGLPALTTNTPEEYIDRAVHLAHNVDTLSYLRQEMRGHLVKTPLFNTRLFLSGLEDAYFQIFERWCREEEKR